MMRVNRVGVAVRLMDGITGQPVPASSVWIRMEDGATGVRKEDGYVVFWDNGLAERVLLLQSPYYAAERIVLDIGKLHRKRIPAVLIWLKPGLGYPYQSTVRLKEQTAEPDSIVRVFLEHSEGLIRLAEAYPADQLEPRLIALKVPPQIEVEGRILRIRRLSDEVQEEFTIWQARNVSAGLYELEQPLKAVYSVYDEAIGLFLEFKTGSDGICRVPAMDEGM